MKFQKFAEYLEQIQNLSSRNEIMEKVSDMYRRLDSNEYDKATYMMQGRVAPAYLPIEFNFSTMLIIRALSSVFNISTVAVEKEYKFLGDIGLTSEKFSYLTKSKGVSLLEVYTTLEKIALTSGTKAHAQKAQLFINQAKKLGPLELKYFSRILVGSLRLGLSVKTILDAMSWSISSSKEHKKLLENAYGVRCDLGSIANIVNGPHPLNVLRKIQTQVGIPVASKLVEREKSIEAIVKRMGPVFIQPKYDGLRMQIHYSKKGFAKQIDLKALTLFEDSEIIQDKLIDHVRLFSRNLEDITLMFPELAEDLQSLDIESVILDGEAIGFDPSSNDFLDFQETIKRKRKYDIGSVSEKFPIEVHVFDILEINGKDLLHTKIEDRLALLKSLSLDKKTKRIKLTQTNLVDNAEDIEKLFLKYSDQNLEGIIAKDENTFYEPGTRNFDWIKYKTSYTKGVDDSIDTVVLGYYLGAGQRVKFGIGAILVGIYDDKKDMYLSLAKVGTGMKDVDWPKIKEAMNNIRVNELPHDVLINDLIMPDVLVKPEIVAVIEADSISISKTHNVDEVSNVGYSLRFPRLKQFGRDKRPEDATTLSELIRLYELQGKGKVEEVA
jgi:DNA ligase-1